MEHVKRWTVTINIEDEDGRTQAVARLLGTDTDVVATGKAYCVEPDFDVPEIGTELAVSRALYNLAHRLEQDAAGDLQDVRDRRAALA